MTFRILNKCDHIVARPTYTCCAAEVRSITRRVTLDLTGIDSLTSVNHLRHGQTRDLGLCC